MIDAIQPWLKIADADLAAAEHNLATGFPHHWVTAFHAQQAVEKFLKAYLVARGDVDFPFSHNIRQLRLRLAGFDPDLAESLIAADPLTPYATWSRYPEREPDVPPDSNEVSMEAAHAATIIAREVRTRILQHLSPPRP